MQSKLGNLLSDVMYTDMDMHAAISAAHVSAKTAKDATRIAEATEVAYWEAREKASPAELKALDKDIDNLPN